MTTTLLAVLDHAEAAPAVLATAARTAARLPGAAIRALHVRRTADPSFLPTEEIMTPAREAQFAAAEAARSAALLAAFAAWQAIAAVPATWQEAEGEPPAVVAQAAGAADLVVIGRPPPHAPYNGRAIILAALFEAGATVLLPPPVPPAGLGAHIAVAWKRSDAAERAVVAAARLLRGAGRVTVLVGADQDGGHDPPEARVRALAELDRLPEARWFALGGHAAGPALLREAHAVGADLLVMGAYTQAPGIEALLGGATRDILAAADLPVLLHH